MPIFKATATPVFLEEHHGHSVTSFTLFETNHERGEISVSSPRGVEAALEEWTKTLTLPTHNLRGEPITKNAWSCSISKNCGRWPAGYKQAGDKQYTFKVEPEPVATSQYDGPDFN